MNKAIRALLAVAFFLFVGIPTGFAANTATVQAALPIRLPNGVGPVYPYVVAIDTTGSDLTIRTPATGNMVCVVGWQFAETNAANITFKSGTTTNVVFELAANQGVLESIHREPLYCTQPSEALKVQSSAAISSLLFYVVEPSRLDYQ